METEDMWAGVESYTVDPNCKACKGTGEVTVSDGYESASLEMCHCVTWNG